MKKYNRYLIGITIIFLLAAFSLDRSIFYYGLSYIEYPSGIPLGLKPKYQGPENSSHFYGFTFEDKHGFRILPKYISSNLVDRNLKGEKISSYGFNKESIVFEVKDSVCQNNYIEYKRAFTKSANELFRQEILQKKDINMSEYKWINIESNLSRALDLYYIRNIFIVISGLSFIGSLIGFSRARRT